MATVEYFVILCNCNAPQHQRSGSGQSKTGSSQPKTGSGQYKTGSTTRLKKTFITILGPLSQI